MQMREWKMLERRLRNEIASLEAERNSLGSFSRRDAADEIIEEDADEDGIIFW